MERGRDCALDRAARTSRRNFAGSMIPTAAVLADSLARSILEYSKGLGFGQPTARNRSSPPVYSSPSVNCPRSSGTCPQISWDVRKSLVFACRRAVEAELPRFF